MKPWLQNLIPQHGLSHFMGKLANAKLGPVTRWAIRQFIAHYRVNMDEAKISDYKQFHTFNDFFTRELKVGARTLPLEKNVVMSPVDGYVSECGAILQDQLFQAKGAYFNLRDLCGGDETVASHFVNGSFLTAYLSPRDYHRFHLPVAGKLTQMIYVPGKLFSVNPSSVKNVSGLFAKNERVICIFETELGKMAFIAVGAMIVGSIATQWHGIVAPQQKRIIKKWDYRGQPIGFERGAPIGHFLLGSTVILLFEQNKVSWDAAVVTAGKSLQLGDVLARA